MTEDKWTGDDSESFEEYTQLGEEGVELLADERQELFFKNAWHQIIKRELPDGRD